MAQVLPARDVAAAAGMAASLSSKLHLSECGGKLMNSKYIYLAGPISGLSYEGCTDWRKRFEQLMGTDFVCLSPMRGKEYLASEPSIGDHYPKHVMSHERGITTRDYFDTRRARTVVANLLGADRVSIGTVMEIAWTYAHRIPLIAVMEPEGNVHDHGMIREAIGFRVQTLEEAAHVAKVVVWR